MSLPARLDTSTSKTATKLRTVRVLSLPLIRVRQWMGLPKTARKKRLGLLWDLDPSEAIDACLYIARIYEPELVHYYRKFIRPGMTILDIGANRGAHAFPMAACLKNQGEVHALEATSRNVGILKQTLDLNPELKSVLTPHHVFLTSESAETQAFVSASWNIAKPINDKERNVLDGGFAVSTAGALTLTLDQWVENQNLKKIDLIKLDVDGNEVQILKGAQKTLKQFRPLVLVEFSPIHYRDRSETFAEQVNLLKNAGYEFQTLEGKLLPQSAEEIEKQIPWGVLVNVLGVPK